MTKNNMTKDKLCFIIKSNFIIKSKLFILFALFSFMFVSNVYAKSASEYEVDVKKVSKTFGYFIGKNLEAPTFKFDLDSIILGMKDAVAGKPAPMPEDEYEKAITKIQEKAFNNLSKTNLDKANEFMIKNANEKGIIEVEKGKLQYKINKEGDGQELLENMVPVIHYTGTFLDGTVFGGSLDGEPISLSIDQAIPGFKGLNGMKIGEKRTLYIHPDLGYGTKGHLPPNSLLIFDVELIRISKDTDSKVEDNSEQSVGDDLSGLKQ